MWPPGTAHRRPVYYGCVIGQPLTEEDLLARAREGDVDAFAVIVRAHEAVAMRTAAGIAPSATDAEEAVQDAFVKAYGALDRLRPGAPLAPWLLTIVANEARNRRRSAGRREQLARRAAVERHGEATSPEAAAVSAAEREELRAALARLRHEDREVIGYRYVLDLSEEETARALGVRRGTVKSRLSRALDRLRAEMGIAAAVLAALALIAGLLAASPDARSTVLRWLGLEGARIERREPAVPPGRRAAPLDLGERVTPGELRGRQRFKIARPRLAALGPPTAVYLDERAAPGGAVTLTWSKRPQLTGHARKPAGSAPALLLTEVLGSIRPSIGKAAGPATRIEPVRIGGRRGFWLSGAPHEVGFLDARGEPRAATLRLAGDTLLWEAGGLLLRLEGAASKPAALRIAQSMGPPANRGG